MRPYVLLALSGCSFVVDYDPDRLLNRDGQYVLIGTLAEDDCDTPSASTVRLPLVIKGQHIDGPFSCENLAVITPDTFDTVWNCDNYRALLSGDFAMDEMVGSYTLSYPSCQRHYTVTGSRQR
jgi:hypothetical protein